jgi:hypothetical protein
MFANHVYKIIILPTLVIRIPNLEIFLFCQHNSTGGGNLELRQTIHISQFEIRKLNVGRNLLFKKIYIDVEIFSYLVAETKD